MKKSVVIIILVLLIAAAGGAFYLWQNMQRDPVHAARAFLTQLEMEDFSDIESHFSAESYPVGGGLEHAYARFRQAFGLSGITFTDLTLLSKDTKAAEFNLAMLYESLYFEPLTVETKLRLERESIFADWKVEWDDNLPLPKYGSEADYARVRQAPRRGRILDRNGRVLAGEGSLVSVGVQPDRITDSDALLEALQSELNLNPEYVRRQYEAPGVQGHWFVPLVSLSEDEYRRVDPVLRPIPGIFFRRVDARAYPEGAPMGHITGYLGEVTANMLETFPEREYISGELVGRAGLELSQDDLLRGRPGYRFYVEVDGESILLAEKAAIHGQDVVITLDSRLQQLAFEVLGDQKGALVVLDAETGEILALASTPSYDANEFVGGISAQRWQELSTDERLPMFNRALQGLYAPGSAFKVVTVAAAIDQGLYNAGSTFSDTGELLVQGNIVRNYQRQVFGEHNLHQAVVESINTTVAQIGLDLGAAALEEYFTSFGLDKSHSLGLPMVNGQLGTPGRSKVALAWSAIGQDQVLLTPLHVAQIFGVFANDGHLSPVHLLAQTEQPESSQVLKRETVTQLNSMLQDVVLQGTGTALRGSGLAVLGKTGTAEVAGKAHAWFGGHTELPSGQSLAFSILIEEGGVGGQTAAPLMGEYLNRLLQ
ncbi:MAG: hypothetical protein GX251_11795 [Firmicutes bacterium]|nr:hypothetical protein [Bacillota bacterium]